MAKILVLGKYYPPFSGGIEVSTRDVSEGLAKDNDVEVFCFNHQNGSMSEVINGVKIRRFGVLGTVQSQPLSFRMFWNILFAKADIIHFHAPNFVVTAALFLKLCLFGYKTRLIITHHTDIFGRTTLRKLLLPMYWAVLRKSTFVLVTSWKLIKISKDLLPGLSYRVIPLGITPANFKYREEDIVTPSAVVGPVGFIARHARYKGLSILISALGSLPGVYAEIAGDGPTRAEAEDLVDKLGIRDRTRFLGDIRDQDKKIAFYKAIGIFAFPSTEVTETFGVAQLEAMLMGVPVVASNLQTGVTDVSIHEETALLVEPGNPQQLAMAIRRLHDDRALRERLIKNARQHVLENFTNQVVIGQTVALFAEALRDKASDAA